MKNLKKTGQSLTFEEYKAQIDNLISTKKIDKLKLQENYFDVCGNYWIIDTYICKNGVVSESDTPNTFSAYRSAIANNYAITLPVQLLDDDNIVCFSHKCLSKVLNSTSGYLNKLNLSEVKEMNLNDNQEKMPTLEEALGCIEDKVPVIIEIQNELSIGKFEDKVLNILQKYIAKHNCYNRVAIMSANPYSLEYCFKAYPYITRILKSGIFCEKTYGSISSKKLKKLKYYKITHADFVAYSAEMLPNAHVEKCKPVGVIAHTVTSQNQHVTVAKHCDNIMFSYFKPVL